VPPRWSRPTCAPRSKQPRCCSSNAVLSHMSSSWQRATSRNDVRNRRQARASRATASQLRSAPSGRCPQVTRDRLRRWPRPRQAVGGNPHSPACPKRLNKGSGCLSENRTSVQSLLSLHSPVQVATAVLVLCWGAVRLARAFVLLLDDALTLWLRWRSARKSAR
jgi:Flp pilus assembly protein TadB